MQSNNHLDRATFVVSDLELTCRPRPPSCSFLCTAPLLAPSSDTTAPSCVTAASSSIGACKEYHRRQRGELNPNSATLAAHHQQRLSQLHQPTDLSPITSTLPELVDQTSLSASIAETQRRLRMAAEANLSELADFPDLSSLLSASGDTSHSSSRCVLCLSLPPQ